MYNAYFFDFDYTLANSEKGILTCFHRTLDKLGYPAVDDDRLRHTIGMGMYEVIPLITGETDKNRIELFFKTFLDFAEIHMTPGTEFFPQTLEVLSELRRQGKKIAVISSKRSSRIAEKFALENAGHLTDIILGCLETQNLKPAPDGLLLAMQQLGLAREEILYTGDSIIDAQAAANAGIDFTAVTTGVTKSEAFLAYPHKKIMSSLAELLTD